MNKLVDTIPVVLIFAYWMFPSNLVAQDARQGDYKLVWAEEFNKKGKPNPANWKFEQGFVRNRELQWYQTGNAWCKNGLLIIEGLLRAALPYSLKSSGRFLKAEMRALNEMSSFAMPVKLKNFGGCVPDVLVFGKMITNG